MAQKNSKSGGKRQSSIKARRTSEKIVPIICLLLALLGFIAATKIKSILLRVVVLIGCILAIAAAVLMIRVSVRRQARAKGRRRIPSGQGERQAEPRRPERVPVNTPGKKRPVIDIPLDGEDRTERPQSERHPHRETSADGSAPPAEISAKNAVSDAAPQPEMRDTVTDEGATAGQTVSPVDVPAYKITPPTHHPELFKQPNSRVVVWPGGKVVPASEYDWKEPPVMENAEGTMENAENTGEQPADMQPFVEQVGEIQETETVDDDYEEALVEKAGESDERERPEYPASELSVTEAEPEAEPEPVPEPEPEPEPEPGVEPEPQPEPAAETEKPVLEQPTAQWRYPTYDLLEKTADKTAEEAGAELSENAARLAETLKSFGVEAAAGEAVRGPAVTRYEFTLEPGVKLSKITNLQDDIALALGASGVRIAPIPDKMSVVGVEEPNRVVSPVSIRGLLESEEFLSHPSGTAFAVGKDISGRRIIGDIAKFPHVLIAGTTGSGKSVCTNSLIVSILYKSTPEDVRFIMVDPKMVELAPYNGIPHLLIPVVTDPKKAAGALQWAVYEMMKRYKLFSEHGVKDLASYNDLAAKDASVQKLPTVVVVIDELADLMLIAAKEVEESICRVAQMGRAAGMHLVIATQSPRADVITGLMKANIPSRIAFAVASSLESRIILDNVGAEKLVGKGDMLYAPLGAGKPRRVQGCFISAAEIERVVAFLKANGEANYDAEVIAKIDQNVAEKEVREKTAVDEPQAQDEGDPMFYDAVDVILEAEQASVSMLQRRLKLGYSRAARLVDQMEEIGIVGPFEGSKPRKILITREAWEKRKALREEAMDPL